MTFEKWKEEMAKEIAKEILFPSTPLYLIDADKRYNFIGDEEDEEEERATSEC